MILDQALTRRQIIKIWNNQNDKKKDSYCCPDCRDLLISTKEGSLMCNNHQCKNTELYTIKGELL